MRTFEVPAMGGCMLTEHTEDHEVILGADGEAVAYFQTPVEMVERLRQLLSNPADRRRLAEQARRRITGAANTYQDRLQTLLGAGEVSTNAALTSRV
jgi:spore maturation protein CgeB